MAEKSEESQSKKQPMSEEERKLLCEKLDNELNEYISGLEQKSYSEGWPQDRWEEVSRHFSLCNLQGLYYQFNIISYLLTLY
jgi:hypothetical protein